MNVGEFWLCPALARLGKTRVQRRAAERQVFASWFVIPNTSQFLGRPVLLGGSESGFGGGYDRFWDVEDGRALLTPSVVNGMSSPRWACEHPG